MSNNDNSSLDLENQVHKQMYDYWRSKAPAGGLPGRQHIDPLDIPNLLPTTALVDVIRRDGKTSFCFRLIGTEIAKRAERDVTGKFFEDIYEGDHLDRMLTTYAQAVDKRQALCGKSTFPVPNRDFLHYTRLLLPLAEDGETVDMLLVSVNFTETK